MTQKKTCLLYFILLFIFNSYSQTSNGLVTYAIKQIDFELKNDKKTKTSSIVSDVLENAKNHTFSLEFQEKRSKFYLNGKNSIEKDNKKEMLLKNLASTRYTSSNTYYIDHELNIELEVQNDGTIIKKSNTKSSWILLNETKNIDSYLCYKAKYEKKYIGRDGKEKTINIIAWYAPQLPYAFGPKDYNDLPGLILELTEKETTYLATNINLNPIKKVYVKLPKGKYIPEEEFTKRILTR
jgi:GLPGLI family protein